MNYVKARAILFSDSYTKFYTANALVGLIIKIAANESFQLFIIRKNIYIYSTKIITMASLKIKKRFLFFNFGK